MIFSLKEISLWLLKPPISRRMTKFLSSTASIRKVKVYLVSSRQQISSKHKAYQALTPSARWCCREEVRKINETPSIVGSQFLVSNLWWVKWPSLVSSQVVSSLCSLWWWEACNSQWGCIQISLHWVDKIPSNYLAFQTKTQCTKWLVAITELCLSISTSRQLRSNIIPSTSEAKSCLILSISSMQ